VVLEMKTKKKHYFEFGEGIIMQAEFILENYPIGGKE
jgi:hypothetical protein